MSLERKLRLLLPTGNLADPNKWTVYHMLERAGLGTVTIDRKDPKFIPKDKEIEVDYLKPRDIPSELRHGEGDIGVTGEDCMKEEGFNKVHPDGDFLELLDLGCGYVDWCFISNPEKIKRIKRKLSSEDLKQNFGEIIEKLDDFELFLFAQGVGMSLNCRTENTTTAKKDLEIRIAEITKRFCLKRDFYTHPFWGELKVLNSSGQTERFLNRNEDFIFECVATGGSMKKYKGVILKKISNSSAKLYSSYWLSTWLRWDDILGIKSKTLERKETSDNEKLARWQYEKAMYIKEKLEEVVKDVEDYFQLSVKIGERGYLNLNGIYHFDLKNTLESIDNILPIFNTKMFASSHSKTECDYLEFKLRTNKPELIRDCCNANINNGFQITIPKKYLKEVVQEIDGKTLKKFKQLGLDIKAFELKSLYAYCPLFFKSNMGKESVCYHRREDIPLYPVDSSKLRPEHHDDALIFHNEGENIRINEKYKHLLENQ